MLNLQEKQYDRETLKKNIYAISLWDILKTQKLDVTFIVRYILNGNYQLTESEKWIDIKSVLFFQPHITEKELKMEIQKYDNDDDSVLPFDYYLQ